MISAMLVAVLAVHLMATNVAGAAPLVCLWCDARAVGRDDHLAGDLGRYLAWQSVIYLSLGVVLGLALLGLLWIGPWQPFWDAARSVPASRYGWGVLELLFYYGCMAGYLALWPAEARPASRTRIWARRALGLLAGTNLLYHFPPLFTVIGVYSNRDPAAGGALNFRAALVDPEVLSQAVHHVLASFAVVGIVILGYSLRLGKRADRADDARRAAVWGARIALVPTAAQLAVGLWVLLSLPEYSRAALLGRDPVASGLFIVALCGTLALLHRLTGMALGDVERRDLIAAMAMMVLIVVSMVAVQQRVRQPWPALGAAPAGLVYLPPRLE